MDSSTRLRVNAPKVIHEIIDGEAVIIDFDTGNYYSLDKVGTEVWAFIERSADLADIREALCGRYDGSREEIERAVVEFVGELQRENLVVLNAAEATEGMASTESPAHPEPASGRAVFEPPVLYKYDDMQELLLLDPIHEVDETGWPTVGPQGTFVDE
jgi:hypothetical protein